MSLTKVVYAYTPDGGYYLGETVAFACPVSAGRGEEKFLMPRNTTGVKPPSVANGQYARWDGAQWSVHQIVPNYVSCTTSAPLNKGRFAQEVLAAFGAESSLTGTEEELSSTSQKTIHVDGVPGTPENIVTLVALVNAHNYQAAQLDVLRGQRNTRLSAADWIVQRHLEQRELVTLGQLGQTSISEQKFAEWLQYKQQLRDYVAGVSDVDDPPDFPATPS
jgi:hypothetical protein